MVSMGRAMEEVTPQIIASAMPMGVGATKASVIIATTPTETIIILFLSLIRFLLFLLL